jgi:CheY-like chemotaxis protein
VFESPRRHHNHSETPWWLNAIEAKVLAANRMNHTVLVVDDDPILREVAAAILEGEGFGVIQAEDGLQAMDALAAARVDLVLCDVFMPNMDGFETLRAIRQRWPDLPVIMMTAGNAYQPPERMLHTARLFGVAGELIKPLNRDRLMAKVTEALRPRADDAAAAVP